MSRHKAKPGRKGANQGAPAEVVVASKASMWGRFIKLRNTRAPHFTPQHWLLCHMGLY